MSGHGAFTCCSPSLAAIQAESLAVSLSLSQKFQTLSSFSRQEIRFQSVRDLFENWVACVFTVLTTHLDSGLGDILPLPPRKQASKQLNSLATQQPNDRGLRGPRLGFRSHYFPSNNFPLRLRDQPREDWDWVWFSSFAL